jgi:succinyl-CoA synthetase beta subunit
MRLFEYQGKELFRRFGIRVPRSELAYGQEQVDRAVDLIGLPVVIKSQVLSGGRGKAGGIVMVNSRTEAETAAQRLFSLAIGGERPTALLVEEVCRHETERYLSVTLDRGKREFVVIASKGGGVDVESQTTGVVEEPVPADGLDNRMASSIATRLGVTGATSDDFRSTLLNLERLCRVEECELVEVNPLVVNADGDFVALDSKITLDDNSLFRHPEFSKLPPDDPLAGRAAEEGFAFVRLEGDIAVIGNGAGLVLSTMDMVADAGGKPACFLDLGGGSQKERVEAALRLARDLPNARRILINVFAGITRTSDVAEALKQVLLESGGTPPPLQPIYARISGAGEVEAALLLADSPVKLFRTPEEAVLAAVGAGSA